MATAILGSQAFRSEHIRLLKNPPSRPMAAPPRNVGPPDPVPADIQEDVAKLAMPLQTLLVPLPLPLPLRLRLRLRLPLPLQEDTVGCSGLPREGRLRVLGGPRLPLGLSGGLPQAIAGGVEL